MLRYETGQFYKVHSSSTLYLVVHYDRPKPNPNPNPHPNLAPTRCTMTRTRRVPQRGGRASIPSSCTPPPTPHPTPPHPTLRPYHTRCVSQVP